MWHIDEILETVRGEAINIDQQMFTGISTDSRTIKEGELFIPLKGERFDGHEYLDKAYAKSKGGVLCEKAKREMARHLKGTVILVDNTLDALADLAHYKRGKVDTMSVAITGSNGKTTTKELLINMTKRAFAVHYNEKNYNNLIGVSMSILSIVGKPDISIFELGTNSRGEIRRLADIVRPKISLITNVNPSHLEGLSDIKGILEEKLSLFYCTDKDGLVVINMDDPLLSSSYLNKSKRHFTYGIENKADFSLKIEEPLGWDGYILSILHRKETIKVKTSLLGKHNLYNILAASSVAYSVGTNRSDIEEGIETFHPYAMRFRPYRTKKGYLIVDDTYNANPSSMEWAIKTLLELPCRGKRIAILGDMKELGNRTAYYHRALVEYLKASGLDMVFLIGDEMGRATSEKEGLRHFEKKDDLIGYVSRVIEAGDVVIVKGSRAEKMDEIVEALK